MEPTNDESGTVNSPSFSANSTGSQLPLKSPGYTIFFVILTLLAFASVLLKIWTIAALVRDSTILKTLRALLINIFVAELVIAVAVITVTTSSAVLSARATQTTPSEQFCRFINWLLAASVTARIYGLTAYITIIVVYITCGWKMFKATYVVTMLVGLWILAGVFGADRWIPQSIGAVYIQGVTCSSVAHEDVILSVRLTFGTLWILLGGIIPLIICSSVTIAGICQLKKHNIQDSAVSLQYKKSVTKLVSVLLIGNLINLFCVGLPSLGSIISSFPQAKVDGVAVVTIFISALSLSLYPTHIIVMICIQTVRRQMIAIICCCQPFHQQRKVVTEQLKMRAMALLVVNRDVTPTIV